MKIKARKQFTWDRYDFLFGDGTPATLTPDGVEIHAQPKVVTKDGRDVEIAGVAVGKVLGCIKSTELASSWTLDGRSYKNQEHGTCSSDLYFEEEIEVDPREMAVEIADKALEYAKTRAYLWSTCEGSRERQMIAQAVEYWLLEKGIVTE